MKSIEFATRQEFIPNPTPAIKFIPNWYKQIPVKPTRIDPSKGVVDKSLKHCIPFLDVMSHGYMATLWQDIDVQQVNGDFTVNWQVQPDVVEFRNNSYKSIMPVPEGFSDVHFVWKNPYIMKTPVGYSVLITHPFNRFDLPFQTLSALVDADSVFHDGNVPFFLKKDFAGVIPKGTPLFQITLIKRESWESKNNQALVKKADENHFNSNSVLSGWYKKFAWHKKSFK